jgi:2-isopropylmalate synthase
MVEGSLCGYGNRSGITPIELLVATCLDKHITLGSVPLDLDLLCKAAQAAEVTFLQIPSAFRPVSGQFVKKANFGVLNIPDFLNADGERDYFLNVVNLHPATIRRALNGADFRPEHCKNERFIADVSERLRSTIESRYEQQVSEYEALIAQLLNFYRSAQLTKTDIVRVANEVRCDREPTDNPFMYHESLHAD